MAPLWDQALVMMLQGPLRLAKLHQQPQVSGRHYQQHLHHPQASAGVCRASAPTSRPASLPVPTDGLAPLSPVDSPDPGPLPAAVEDPGPPVVSLLTLRSHTLWAAVLEGRTCARPRGTQRAPVARQRVVLVYPLTCPPQRWPLHRWPCSGGLQRWGWGWGQPLGVQPARQRWGPHVTACLQLLTRFLTDRPSRLRTQLARWSPCTRGRCGVALLHCPLIPHLT